MGDNNSTFSNTLETQFFTSKTFQEAVEATDQSAFQKAAESQAKDLGFGAEVSRNSKARLLNKDGTFNVIRHRIGLFDGFSIYHFCLKLSWKKFISLLALSYCALNLFFGILYFLCGPNSLGGVGVGSGLEPVSERFFTSLFFSIQTFSTIGFGNIYPVGLMPNVLVTLEALVGLISVALATGLIFARFSRPSAKILFSSRAVIAPYQDIKAFMFRIVNKRFNELLNMEVRVIFSRLEAAPEGHKRKYYELPLERSTIMFFPLNWTIVHPINETSPLVNETPETLKQGDAEVLILVSGVDDTFSQQVFTPSSYKFHEIDWNAKFVNILEEMTDGTIRTDLTRFNDIERVSS